jgi:EmrB/QacA subfamily drug resistance transporter
MNRTEQDNRVITIVVACLATAMLMLDISVINTALSEIAHGLDTGLGGLQWVVNAYTIPLAATVLTAGAVADRIGRRKLFLLGLTVFTASSALCGAAGGIEVLVGARALQGLGASMMFGTALALISHVTSDPKARAKALAAYGAVMSAAFALGPFIGGSLTEVFGWRAIFLVNLPIGAAGLWLAYRRVGESRDPTPRAVDLPGQITLIAGLFLLVLALLRGNEDGWGNAGIIAALASAAALLTAFVVVEGRSREPMLPLRLFRQARFAGPQVAVFAISSSYFAVFFYLTLYLQTVLGLSPIETGLAYLPGTFLAFVVASMTPRLAGRSSPAKIASVGLALVGAGLAGMLVIGCRLLVDSDSARLPGVEPGHRSLQPDGQRAGPARTGEGAERSRRGHQQHVPPDGSGGRNRCPGHTGAGAGRARREPTVVRRRATPRADRRRCGGGCGGGRDGLAADPRATAP